MKVIVKKGKENEGYYRYLNGRFQLTITPFIHPNTANEKAFIKYAKMFDNVDLDFSDYEFREIEIKLK